MISNDLLLALYPTECWAGGMTQPNRIKELRERLELSLEAVAEAADTSNQQVHKLESGKARLTEDWMRRLAGPLRVKPWELLRDWRPPAVPKAAMAALPAITEAGVIEVGGSEFAALGRFDASFSAGPGSLLEVEAEPLGYYLIERQWLRAVTAAAPTSLAVVRVSGDSMIDTLHDGDWVLVDKTQQRFTREGIYALRVGDDGWIKRLSVNLRDRLIRIISDNPRYPLQELPEEDVSLIGRVLSIVARKL